ncbi:transcription factor 7-like 1-B isoform X2 [Notolabrus celidotus]|uniref:transcription factor 7-like 1-B isoform X2 n=1 Tax=Notolabrus celidotus TaxID=1203425 RepID=UPI00148F9C87|nr:transcription factor 7-like 1-B isoform X2 [Notolabrus celidotus]
MNAHQKLINKLHTWCQINTGPAAAVPKEPAPAPTPASASATVSAPAASPQPACVLHPKETADSVEMPTPGGQMTPLQHISLLARFGLLKEEEPAGVSAGLEQNLQPAHVLSEEVLHEDTKEDFSTSAAPLPSTSESKKRKREEAQDDDRPYIKKPPNAFMIFMNRQREKVPDELKGKKNQCVYLGEKWQSLTDEQRKVYGELAEAERLLHNRLYPDWSSTDNYGRKRKRVRKRAPAKPEVVTRPHHQQPLVLFPKREAGMTASPQTLKVAVIYPSSRQINILQSLNTIWVMKPNPEMIRIKKLSPQSVYVLLPLVQTPLAAPVCNLPQVLEVIPGLLLPQTAPTSSHNQQKQLDTVGCETRHLQNHCCCMKS